MNTLLQLAAGALLSASLQTSPLPPAPTHDLYLPLIGRIGAVIRVTTFQDELNEDGDCALREAVQAANTRTAVDACPAGLGDDLILLPAGTYALTRLGSNEDANVTGDLDILSALTLWGEARHSTTISAEFGDRALDVHQGAAAIVGQLTIENGLADFTDPDITPSACGGGGVLNAGRLTLLDAGVRGNRTQDGHTQDGIYCGGASAGGGICNLAPGYLLLIDTYVANNAAGDGANTCFRRQGPGGWAGGIYNEGAAMILNSAITANAAGRGFAGGYGGNGGGIANDGEMAITHATITGNSAGSGSSAPEVGLPGGGGVGGGIYNRGVMTVTLTKILDNEAGAGLGGPSGDGGGIFNGYFERGFMTVLSTTVANNSAGSGNSHGEPWTEPTGGRGGGILNGQTMYIVASTIYSNVTGVDAAAIEVDGGGIANFGVLTTTNSTISHNKARQTDGGGIYNAGYAAFDHVTIAANTAITAGGGIAVAPYYATTQIKNTVIAGNTAGESSPDCTVVSSAGYNVIAAKVECTVTGDETGNIYDQPARLTELGDNGGPTWTHGLQQNSPAIDAGTCTDQIGAPVPVDQRGVLRPQGSTCDIGAFERETSQQLQP